VAFERNSTLGTRNVIVFVAAVPRPARSRAYASTDALPRPPQGSLPTRWWLDSGRAGFAPAGRHTEFHEVIASLTSLPTGLAWSH
jgi:hypothetical protein